MIFSIFTGESLRKSNSESPLFSNYIQASLTKFWINFNFYSSFGLESSDASVLIASVIQEFAQVVRLVSKPFIDNSSTRG